MNTHTHAHTQSYTNSGGALAGFVAMTVLSFPSRCWFGWAEQDGRANYISLLLFAVAVGVMLCECVFTYSKCCADAYFVDRQARVNINNMLLSFIVKSPISPMCLCSWGLLPKWIHKTVTTQFDFPQPESLWRNFITSCQQTLSVTFWTFLCCIWHSSRRPFSNTQSWWFCHYPCKSTFHVLRFFVCECSFSDNQLFPTSPNPYFLNMEICFSRRFDWPFVFTAPLSSKSRCHYGSS